MPCSGDGDQRHDVVQERAARLDGLVHLDEVLVVDARDHHRVDLAQNAALGQHLEAAHLVLRQDLGGLTAEDALAVPEDPRIDLRADVRIDHVDGDRDVIDIVFGDRVDMLGQREAVRRQAQLDVGSGLRDQLEGLEGLLRIGERVARAGDAEHRHLRDRRRDGQRPSWRPARASASRETTPGRDSLAQSYLRLQ